MNGPVEQLWAVYQQWKNLTEHEGQAIRPSNWPLVQKTQQAKHDLQSRIIHLTEQIQGDFSSKTEQTTFDKQLRKIVNELILLETRNNATLQSSVAAAEQQKASLENTSNRLRQVHTRYVPTLEP